MKVYRGVRTPTGCVVTVTDDGGTRELDPRFDIRRHSPTGFEWSYAGSGPAQLALALAADLLGDDERAEDIYQRLKFRVIGALKGDTWELTERQLLEAIAGLQVRTSDYHEIGGEG